MTPIPGFVPLELLDRGPSRVVVRAQRISDGQPVIYKALVGASPSAADLATFRFVWRLGQRLHHPQLNRVLDLFEVDRRPVLLIEDIGGRSLDRALMAGPFSVEHALRVGLAAAQGLAALHGEGILHKDIKPANLIENDAGQVQIIDFDQASPLSREATALALAPSTGGTLRYISPEQTGRMTLTLDGRGDLYSLGVTLYELLVGEPPFTDADPLTLIHHHMAMLPRPLRERLPGLPPAVEAVVMRLLEKSPEDRYQSALGLAWDLQRLLGDAPGPFVIGARDFSRELQPPRRLYGRRREEQALAEAVGRVAAGGAELWLVSGYAGVGKSALVFGVHRPTTAASGRFAAGKQNQLQNRHFAGLAQCIRAAVEQLFAEPAAALEAARAELASQLGAQGRVVIELVPEAAVLLGALPPLPPLPPREAELRAQQALVGFFQALARPGAPLVLFLDDLQWADAATLSILHLLITDPRTRHLLLLGALRDQEITAHHPFERFVAGLEKQGVSPHRVALGPLADEHVDHILADALQRSPSEVRALSALLAPRSGGNPFFLQRLLQSLVSGGQVRLSPSGEAWTWDAESLLRVGVAENVGALLAAELCRLEPSAVALLQAAAALGSTFDLFTLCAVTGRPFAAVAGDLSEALRQHFVVPLDPAYRYAGDLREGDAESARRVRYAFAHDRVQEAAYASVPLADRPRLHRAIGQRLVELGEDARLDGITHLNLAGPADPADAARLARLNIEAMERARQASAPQAALDFARYGVTCLESGGGELAFPLHHGRAEMARICGLVEEAAAALDAAQAAARSPEEVLQGWEARVALATQQSRFEEAVDQAFRGLAGLGMARPTDAAGWAAATGEALGRAEVALAGRGEADLLALRPMTDPTGLGQLRLLAAVSAAATTIPHVFPLVVGQMMALTATLGRSPQAPLAFIYFAFLQAVGGHARRADLFGRIGVRLAEEGGDDATRATCEQMVGAFVCHWCHPFRQSAAHASRAVAAGLTTGQVSTVAYAAMNRLGILLAQGIPLPELLGEFEQADFLFRSQIRHSDGLGYNLILRYPVLRLVGDAAALSALDAASPGEDAMIAMMAHYPMALANLRVGRLMDLVLRDEQAAGRVEAAAARALMPYGPGLFYLFDLVLYDLLARTAGPAESALSSEALAALEADLALLQTWATESVENVRPRALLAEAELLRWRDRTVEAALRYDEALSAARAEGLLPVEIIAAERCGRMLLRQGRDVLGRAYLAEASFAASRYGAQAVVDRLAVELPAQPVASPQTRSSEPSTLSLDVQAVIAATQTIATEVELPSLLERTLRLLLANAGAERVVLILGEEAEAWVRAEGRAGDAGALSLAASPMAARDDLPQEVLRTALRTGEPVLLVDASRELRYQSTPYVQAHEARSMLAAPLSHQGKRMGLVFLENNLAPGVFSPQRVALVQLIGAQVATAMENALLVERLRAHAVEVQEKNEQLRDLDRLREEFLARTSHELRTPLHGIIGLAQSLIDGADLAAPAAQASLEMIARSGRRLSGLIDDLLDLSTVQRREMVLHLAATDLRAVAEGVLHLCQPLVGGRPIALRVDIPDGMPAALADRDRLEQVLVNLIGNAIKFTVQGEVVVRASVAGAMLEISVQDTGPGIPSDALERIFEPFVQSHAEGSRVTGGAGLGLAVCRELVRLQGGTIQATAVEGVGATFRFTLPIAASAPQSPTAAPATTAAPRPEAAELTLHRSAQPAGGARILVVDDEIVNLQVLVNQLGAAGHEVETCASGPEALDWMRTHARPDLILLDWMMPGMDGLTVCEQIRQSHPAGLLPIILVTARSQPADLVAGLRAGANDYVTKPFSGVELVARIAAHLRLSQTHRAVERFVPHPFLRLLGRESIVDLRLGDSVAQEMAVLQCSLWGFSELAERLGPQDCFRFVNEYLSVAVPPVGQHGGFIDKFVGDEVLALFEGGGDAAVRSAVAMQQGIAAWNERRLRQDLDPVRLGIGLHSGSLMLGTVGEADQMSATVIADTVNLTARLQALSPRYGAGVLVSGVVVANLVDREAYRLRLLDELRVPGRPAPLQVFELFDADPPAVRAAKEATRRSFEAAVEHFHGRAFPEAARLFRLCLAMDPVDVATRQYLDRCQAIQRQLTGDPGW